MPNAAADLIGAGDAAQLIGDRAKVRRHQLARQTTQLAWIAGRLGSRMQHWLRQSALVDGKPEYGPMPDEEWRETFKLYTQAVLGLLKEQRARQEMANEAAKDGSAAVLSAAEYEQELMSLARDTIRAMPDDDLQALLREREAK